MSVLNLQQQGMNQPVFTRPVEVPSTTFGDVVADSFESFKRNFIVGAESQGMYAETTERDKAFKDEFGVSIYQAAETWDVPRFQGRDQLPEHKKKEAYAKVEQWLLAKRKEDPDRYAKFQTHTELNETVKDKARQAAIRDQETKAGATPTSALAGSLVGGFGASLMDPVNVLTLPFGAGAARGILKTALIEAGINMAAETVSQPFVADWQHEIGQEYGFKEMVNNVALAGVFGAGLGGGMKAISKGASKVFGFEQMARTFQEAGDVEAAMASKYMSREAHINENALYKIGEDAVEYRQFKDAVEEINTAVREGRKVDHTKLQVDPQRIIEADASKITDPTLRAKVEEMQDGIVQTREQVSIRQNEEPVFSEKTKFDEEDGTLVYGENAEANIAMRSSDQLDDLADGLGDELGEAVELNILEVDRSAQGQGLGSETLKEVEKAARLMGADDIVLKAEPLSSPRVGEADISKLDDLIRFYEKNGFDVYKRNEKNAIMRKSLVSENQAAIANRTPVDEILADPLEAAEPTLKTQKEIEDFYNSRDGQAGLEAEFETSFKDGDLRIFDEETGREINIEDMKKQFKDDQDFVNTIKSCGVGS